VEEEVKIIKTKIHVRTKKPKVGTKSLVVRQVEIIKVIIQETNV
jgi:hypothetical protein